MSKLSCPYCKSGDVARLPREPILSGGKSYQPVKCNACGAIFSPLASELKIRAVAAELKPVPPSPVAAPEAPVVEAPAPASAPVPVAEPVAPAAPVAPVAEPPKRKGFFGRKPAGK